MVDATEAMESQYLNAEIVERSPTKIVIPIGEGKYENTDFGNRLTVPVQIDGKTKVWRPNKDSVKNIVRDTGSKDTAVWVGKKIEVSVTSMQGKDTVLAKGVASP